MSELNRGDIAAKADVGKLEPELIVTFSKPYLLGDIAYTEMRLREPTAGEMIECDDVSGWAMDVRLAAIVSGIPEVVVRQLGVRDLLPGTRYLGRFLN